MWCALLSWREAYDTSDALGERLALNFHFDRDETCHVVRVMLNHWRGHEYVAVDWPDNAEFKKVIAAAQSLRDLVDEPHMRLALGTTMLTPTASIT